jgi:hypothetical protein
MAEREPMRESEINPIARLVGWLSEDFLFKLLWAIIIGSGIWVFSLPGNESLAFWDMSAGDYVKYFTSLMLVALFIERALEVFITAWRGPAAKEILRGIERLKALAQEAKDDPNVSPAVVRSHNEDVEAERRKMDQQKSRTQRLAFLSSLALGVLVSAVGIRALEPLLDPSGFQGLSSFQTDIFGLVDVILTGALLGGGSDGIHKLVNVFTSYLDETGKQFKGGEG